MSQTEQAVAHDPGEPRGLPSADRRQALPTAIDRSTIWIAFVAAWFLALCFVPDPRPLGAPEWSVHWVQNLTGCSEPTARLAATVALRGTGYLLLGLLVALSISARETLQASLSVVGIGLSLAVLSQWINYQHFPVATQLMLSVPTVVIGSLLGLARGRQAWVFVALVVIAGALLFYGLATGIPDDLDASARMIGEHVLAESADIASGDEGFAEAMAIAFAYAEENSHGASAVELNKAAILALGTLLGEERVADVAKREIDPDRRAEISALRNRITLRGRSDLPRHFWVSAALTVLTDADRSTSVGITKELKDSTPGGSGFSFVDLAANRAGILFALEATRSEGRARVTQLHIRRGVSADDYCPEITDLPEGFSRDDFQATYGGVGGEKSRKVFAEIERRMAACRGLGRRSR